MNVWMLSASFYCNIFSISKLHKDWTVGSVPILVHTDLDLTNNLALIADFL
jgi:hypothetical protein